LRGLKHIHGMTPGQIRRYGEGLLRAVRHGLEAPLPRPPRPERVSFRVRQRYNRLLEWRKEKARQRGVESDMILPRDALWVLARQAPQTLDELETLQDIGPWRRKNYGQEIIGLLNDA
jgi:ribonuclease D